MVGDMETFIIQLINIVTFPNFKEKVPKDTKNMHKRNYCTMSKPSIVYFTSSVNEGRMEKDEIVNIPWLLQDSSFQGFWVKCLFHFSAWIMISTTASRHKFPL